MDKTDMLLAYLEAREVPCPLCGYSLHKLTVPRCPECGRELRLGVSLAEPLLWPWIILLIFTGLAAGIGVFCISDTLRRGWFMLNANSQPRWLTALEMLFMVVMIPTVVGLTGWRRRFLRLARSTQWLAAAVIAATSVIVLVLFGAGIR